MGRKLLKGIPISWIAALAVLLIIAAALIIMFYPMKPSASEEQAITDAVKSHFQNIGADIVVSGVSVTGDTATATATMTTGEWTAPSGLTGKYSTTYELKLQKTESGWGITEEQALSSP
jgi:hypothetical protein